MPCAHPITAHRPANGGPVSFTAPKNDGRAYVAIQLPCGYCILCRREQARQAAVRIYHEANLHIENCFVTLTYSPEEEPPHGGLRYEDLVRFWKRVRKHLAVRNQGKLRYYAVGEYGDKSLRPHYHACIFGHAFTEDRKILRTTPYLLWTQPTLERLWGHGHISIGALNFHTARYTASYVTKKLRSKQQYVYTDEETGELIRLQQPRAFMSKNLAKEWWLQNRHFVSYADEIIINGKPQKPPKMYDRWLKERSPIPEAMIKENRKKQATTLTPTQNRARARNAHAHEQEKNRNKSI